MLLDPERARHDGSEIDQCSGVGGVSERVGEEEAAKWLWRSSGSIADEEEGGREGRNKGPIASAGGRREVGRGSPKRERGRRRRRAERSDYYMASSLGNRRAGMEGPPSFSSVWATTGMDSEDMCEET